MSSLVWSYKDYTNQLRSEFDFLKIPYKSLDPNLYWVDDSGSEKITINSHTRFAWSCAEGFGVSQFQFTSIREAQRKLLKIGKVWSYYPLNSVRRGVLISEGLRIIKKKIWEPFTPLPRGPLGVFSLLDDSTLLYCQHVLPNIPIGSLSFKETPHPPSRAYLKLWEAFTKIGQWPNVKSSVLELGSSPGGWTWVLAKQIGCQVTCLDKGDMDPRIVGLKNVTWHQQDAFTFLSKNLSEPFDWLLSDMACDPHKLLPLVQDWVTKKPFSRCICTIKLTNKIDNTNSLIQQFKDIPNSWVTHLNVNKHELTWIYLGKS